MTKAAQLRAWLLENGFAITGERLTFEDKYYQTVVARFCGETERYTEEELFLGKWNLQSRPPLFAGFVRHEIGVLQRIVDGKSRSAEADASAERSLKEKLEQLL